jgi:glycosyltransferase involved in cell wall biosynthesis
MRPIRLTVVLTGPPRSDPPWLCGTAADGPDLRPTVIRADPAGEARMDVAESIAATAPDVVLVTGGSWSGVSSAVSACRRLRVAVVFGGDAELLDGPRGWRRLPWRLRTWRLLRQFDGCLSSGAGVSGSLRSFGVPPDRIFDVARADAHDIPAAASGSGAAPADDVAAMQLAIACRSVRRHSVEPTDAAGEGRPRILALFGLMVIPGGLERMAFRVVREMRGRGAAVHCIVNDWEHFRITRLAEDAGATWSAAPYRHPLTRRQLTPAKIARMAIEVARVSSDMLRVARAFRPTHVLVSDYQTVLRNVPALLWLRMRNARVVVTLQNAPDQGRFYRAVWRWLVGPFTSAFVCNSSFTERELLAHDVPRRKVRVIPNVAAPRQTSWDVAAERIPGRIIFVGQIIPEKGLALLLDAVGLLRRDGVNATLDVVGAIDGWEPPAYRGYHDRIRARAAAADLAGAVTFLGWREDVPQLMARAAVHCCPSLPEQREAFGLVVLEAKLAALPSVVVPSGFLPDLVAHRVDGWICSAVSAEAIAEGLRFFLEDSARVHSAGRAARDSARRFNPERYADAWQQVFA